MIRSARMIAAGFVLAGAALVGCGSDSSSSNATNAAEQTTAKPAETDENYGGYGTPASSTAESTANTTAPATGGATLTISGFAFSPLTVAAGETITITNEDSANHTVTADDGTFSVKVSGGKTAELVIDAPGTYKIHCNIHPQMSGTIVVN